PDVDDAVARVAPRGPGEGEGLAPSRPHLRTAPTAPAFLFVLRHPAPPPRGGRRLSPRARPADRGLTARGRAKAGASPPACLGAYAPRARGRRAATRIAVPMTIPSGTVS